MNKEDIYHLLIEKDIPFEKMEHEAVFNMEEMRNVHLPHPESEAKNLFVRDDKKQNYYLITVRGDKRVDMREFQRNNGTRRLSFVSDEDLLRILGVIPGAVTPFGILNDAECKVTFFLDEEFSEGTGLIGVHPNDNTATVWLRAADLVRLIREHGNPVKYVKISGV